MVDNFPATPGTGAVQVAAKADASSILHQQTVTEFLDAGGLPSTVAKSNPFPTANQNASQPVIISAANNTAVTIANAPAVLTRLDYFNTSETETVYVKLYNLAAPTSANTPVAVWQIFPYGQISHVFQEPLQFSTAIGVRVTTGASNGDTTSPTGANTGNALYRLS